MTTATVNIRKPSRWRRALKFLFIAILALLTISLCVEFLMRANDARKLPMPGRLVDIGSHHMHMWCEGDGSPTVILDAGAIAFSTSWRAVLPVVAKTTRVCAFDRSGMGWSEAGPGPWDGDQAADELALLLQAASVDEPVVYVGHSLGAMHGRIFADRHRERLAGLLLLEPADPDTLIRESNEERENPLTRNMPKPGCGLRCPVMTFVASTGLARWILSDQEILADPKLPELAVQEFVARSVRPANIRHLAVLGKYFPRIFFQTLDNTSLGDIPVIFGYGSQSGQLLGDHTNQQEWREDYDAQLIAWRRTGETSTRFLGMREVADANHLSLTMYPEYARAVASMVDELVTMARDDQATLSRIETVHASTE
jgi:pimeloyl-ACP methyl ester carboxylesterase